MEHSQIAQLVITNFVGRGSEGQKSGPLVRLSQIQEGRKGPYTSYTYPSPQTKTPRSTPDRLRTFEGEPMNWLLIRAGNGEMDQRPIYRGPATGRHAIVPIDEIEQEWDQTAPTERTKGLLN